MYSPRTPDSTNTNSLGTRTRTSIRRLFRTKSTVENLAVPQPADPVPKAPVSVVQSPPRLFRSQTFDRPSSSRSTRSVRNIFSSAKQRITLRPSTLFKPKPASVPIDPPRHQEPDIIPRQYGAFLLDNRNMQHVQEQRQHAREQSDVSAEYKHTCHPPVPTTPLPAVPCTPPASSLSSSPLPETPAEQAKSPGAFSSKSLGLRSLDFEYNELCVNALMPATPPATMVDVTTLPPLESESAECTAIDMSWIEQGPLVTPHIPTAENMVVNMIDIGALDRMDSAHEIILPSDAIPMACRNSSALNDACPYYTLVSQYETPVPLNVAALIGSLGSVSRICTAALKKGASDSQFVVSDIDELLRELGFADEFIQGADVESIAGDEYPLLGTDSDVFSLKEIDELIEQLGNADFAQIITANSPRTECRQIDLTETGIEGIELSSMFSTQPRPRTTDATSIGSTERPLDIASIVYSLGCVKKVVSSSVSQIVASVNPIDVESIIHRLGCVKKVVSSSLSQAVIPVKPVDIASIINYLGCVEDVVTTSVPRILHYSASNQPLDSAAENVMFDSAALVSKLGRIIQPVFVSTLLITDVIGKLGNVENVVSLAVPAIPSKQTHDLLVSIDCDPADIVSKLGNVDDIIPASPRSKPFDSAALVRRLGNTNQLSRLITPKPHNLVIPDSPALYVPDIIAELGGVYSPDFMVHDMERVQKSSARNMVDTDKIPDLFGFRYKKQFLPALSPAITTRTIKPMDVDEYPMQSRSRTVSFVSTDASDSIGNIARLITALRIPPIIVSRPFLGPLRNVLFSDFC